jgi:flavin-binding protein dodecin
MTFTGTSPNGDLTEAIRDALNKAAATNDKIKAWKLEETGGDQFELGPISVKIQVLFMGGLGENPPAPKPPKNPVPPPNR